jgi:CheY-like chemotaxis protein
MDGYETVRKLISDPVTARLPIIAVTASAFDEDKKIVAKSGFSGYVRKPFQPQDIFEILQEKLDLDFELAQSSSGAKKGTVTVGPQDIRALEEETKTELRTALERGNMTRFKALLNKIAPTAPELAAAMSEMAGRYEYDRLTELLGGK